jgi:AICAR transformylase/IMP cyclohydrolase PurH
MEKEKRKQLMEAWSALIIMKKAYNDLLDVWHQDEIDLNDLKANNLYPFEQSFDEIEINEWLDAAISELREML